MLIRYVLVQFGYQYAGTTKLNTAHRHISLGFEDKVNILKHRYAKCERRAGGLSRYGGAQQRHQQKGEAELHARGCAATAANRESECKRCLLQY